MSSFSSLPTLHQLFCRHRIQAPKTIRRTQCFSIGATSFLLDLHTRFGLVEYALMCASKTSTRQLWQNQVHKHGYCIARERTYSRLMYACVLFMLVLVEVDLGPAYFLYAQCGRMWNVYTYVLKLNGHSFVCVFLCSCFQSFLVPGGF